MDRVVESKRQWLREKYNNLKTMLISCSDLTTQEFNESEEIKEFINLSEEDLILFAINKLTGFKNNLDYPSQRIMEVFKISDQSKKGIIINYLQLFLSVIQ